MFTQTHYAVSLLGLTIASSATATASPATIDLGDYFPVGKREVKFCVAIVTNSTITAAANVTILEGDSTASANSTSTSLSSVKAQDGSSLTWTSTADTSVSFETHGFLTKRYLTVRYNAGQATTGSAIGIAVFAILPRREN